MKQTDKLASAAFLIKQTNSGRIMSLLKSLGLLGAGAVTGGVFGENAGYNRGVNTATATANANAQKDLLKGLELMLKDISQKGRAAQKSITPNK
jgi:hypothetical protein